MYFVDLDKVFGSVKEGVVVSNEEERNTGGFG